MDKEGTSNMLLQHVIDIKTSIGGIEEHLKQLNSKVATQERRLNQDCPLKHKELEEKISRRREDINGRLDELEKGHVEIKAYSKFTVRAISIIFAIAQIITAWFISR